MKNQQLRWKRIGGTKDSVIQTEDYTAYCFKPTRARPFLWQWRIIYHPNRFTERTIHAGKALSETDAKLECETILEILLEE